MGYMLWPLSRKWVYSVLHVCTIPLNPTQGHQEIGPQNNQLIWRGFNSKATAATYCTVSSLAQHTFEETPCVVHRHVFRHLPWGGFHKLSGSTSPLHPRSCKPCSTLQHLHSISCLCGCMSEVKSLSSYPQGQTSRTNRNTHLQYSPRCHNERRKQCSFQSDTLVCVTYLTQDNSELSL